MIRLTLPLPPLLNRYYRTDKGITHLSGEGRAYKRDVFATAKAAGVVPLQGAVRVRIDVYRKRKAGDLDGFFKGLLDALNGVAYVDDSQIVEIHARRFDDKAAPRVEVCIEEVEA